MAADILGMPSLAEVSSEIAEGRAAWLALAAGDTWRITKPGAGAPVLDEETGKRTAPDPVTVYLGPARLQIRADANSNIVEVTAGEKEWAYQTAILAIPVALPTVAELAAVGWTGTAEGDPSAVHIDMTATCVAAGDDPALAGRVFQIRALMHKTHATARRLRVTETVG